MEGPSPDPVPGRRGSAGHWVGLIGLALVAFLSIGLLSWITPLVAAVRTRKRADWAALVLTSAVVVVAFVFVIVGSESTAEEASRKALGEPERKSVLDDIGMIMLIVLMVAVPIWWCVVSSRWARAAGAGPQPAGYAPWHPQQPVHGHPGGQRQPVQPRQPVPPHAVHPQQSGPRPPVPPPAPPTYLPAGGHASPHVPPSAAAAPPPAPDDPAARARARLQGLSDRLREQDGGNSGGSR
ncbi:hypothetical protein [Embleya sp. NBC_00896]|uniref:hypothetical protein n=1 Tax=Embleya sp. NBC_00896 TaxID=2975961 RepID=UPI00386ABFDE|nr:hypothetical protein OG928_25240 [Embleya sp. NBC_00896]